MNVPHILMKPIPATQNENARVEISKDQNGWVAITIRDAKHPEGYMARVSPSTAIEIALTMLESAGLPIAAALRLKMRAGGGMS